MNLLQAYQDKWMLLSKRERWMIFGAGLIAIVGLMDTFMLDPLRQQQDLAQQEIARMQEEIAKTNLQLAKMQGQGAKAVSPLQSEIERLNKAIEAQKQNLAEFSTVMVGADEILPLLKNLLKKHESVQLVKFESLPPTSFVKKHIAQSSGNASQAVPSLDMPNLDDVYQHTIVLTIKGDYLAVLNYAEDLKRQHQKLAWENAEMKTEFPQTELTLNLYTLSMQKAWLGI